ncbi:MAG: hypothetical protein PHP00_09140 [Thiotrichaceae bacterium]|nr:hypothetical protein [Thiotrichaceae bacterium]
MNIKHFEDFQKLLALGKRAEASDALKLFIESFSSSDDKLIWTKHYLKHAATAHKIHYQLYEHVIFPVLLDGYQRNDPWSLRWLVRTITNLYQAKKLWQHIDFKNDYMLLEQLLVLYPNDEQIKAELLSKKIKWFDYSVHEWPLGILYGANGATLNECYEIIEDIKIARNLDSKNTYESFIKEFEDKLLEYMERLKQSRLN